MVSLDLNSKNITGTGFIELTAGNTYDPTGSPDLGDTSNNVMDLHLLVVVELYSVHLDILEILLVQHQVLQLILDKVVLVTLLQQTYLHGHTGSVNLKYNADNRLSTVSTGVNVTGDLTITDTDTGSSAQVNYHWFVITSYCRCRLSWTN